MSRRLGLSCLDCRTKLGIDKNLRLLNRATMIAAFATGPNYLRASGSHTSFSDVTYARANFHLLRVIGRYSSKPSETSSSEYTMIVRTGNVRCKMALLLTDVASAALLRYVGYKYHHSICIFLHHWHDSVIPSKPPTTNPNNSPPISEPHPHVRNMDMKGAANPTKPIPSIHHLPLEERV